MIKHKGKASGWKSRSCAAFNIKESKFYTSRNPKIGCNSMVSKGFRKFGGFGQLTPPRHWRTIALLRPFRKPPGTRKCMTSAGPSIGRVPVLPCGTKKSTTPRLKTEGLVGKPASPVD